MKLLTIFTPTYNRENYLKELYNSLVEQKDKRFEWIIIDDSSTDDTDAVVKSFLVQNSEFEIIYKKQPHGGKHRAINEAVKIARGEFFFIVDSDDKLTSNAVEYIYNWVETIEEDNHFCGVAGLKISPKGNIWGGNPTVTENGYVDATSLERTQYELLGDKAEVYRTQTLLQYPFPEFEGEYFVTEAVVWDAIAADGYKIRWFNKAIYVCDYHEDGLTATGANEITGHLKNYQGYLYYIRQCRKIKNEYDFILNFSDYEKTAKFKQLSIKKRANEIGVTISRYCIYKFAERPIFLTIRKVRAKL